MIFFKVISTATSFIMLTWMSEAAIFIASASLNSLSLGQSILDLIDIEVVEANVENSKARCPCR